jgi:GT2 family glycosyltransferase
LENKIDISIVIVNYNVKDFLLQCLRSIEKSITKRKYEIIVVDNNSIDESIEFLSPLFEKVDFISLNDNLGFGKANNVGFDKASGKYLLILNPDTIISEDTLDKMYDFMELNPEIGISGCKVLNQDGSFQVTCRRGFPTPWASFTKLFGLQNTFPNSKFFAQYNQTYKSINESYEIDAVIGAFMFCRFDIIRSIGGFDPDYFMYGEDLDLCFRVKELGSKIFYFHQTTIIHFKGESTKRSNINELKHFYEAMEIYAQKHYSNSNFFFWFLKLGIILRGFVAYLNRNSTTLIFFVLDSFILCFTLLLSTKIWKGEFFNFPSYAYPKVFWGISIVNFFSMLAVGEYFEGKQNFRKAFSGLMLTFFVLTFLTYYFKEYAFSRGILLITVGISIFNLGLIRFFYSIVDKIINKEFNKKVLIIGINENSIKLAHTLESNESNSIEVVGFISTENSKQIISNYKILGSIDYFDKILSQNQVNEILVCDVNISQIEIIRLLTSIKKNKIKIHIANEYEELVASRILSDISNDSQYNNTFKIALPRYIMIKRFIDIMFSLILLTIGLPLLYLFSDVFAKSIKNVLGVLKGNKSIVGISKTNDKDNYGFGKEGLIGLSTVTFSKNLNENSKRKLNDYYLMNYSLALDFDIMFKFLIRKKSGK